MWRVHERGLLGQRGGTSPRSNCRVQRLRVAPGQPSRVSSFWRTQLSDLFVTTARGGEGDPDARPWDGHILVIEAGGAGSSTSPFAS